MPSPATLKRAAGHLPALMASGRLGRANRLRRSSPSREAPAAAREGLPMRSRPGTFASDQAQNRSSDWSGASRQQVRRTAPHPRRLELGTRLRRTAHLPSAGVAARRWRWCVILRPGGRSATHLVDRRSCGLLLTMLFMPETFEQVVNIASIRVHSEWRASPLLGVSRPNSWPFRRVQSRAMLEARLKIP
jgi:hypothetical protein